MKKNLILIGLCLLTGYLVFAFFFFDNKPMDAVCTHFQIESKNSEDKRLVEVDQIEKIIDQKGLNPYGKQLKEINTLSIQNAILEDDLIKSAEVFITSDGGIRAVIQERIPILRIISSGGENYYVDEDGHRMTLSKYNTAYIPLATGDIKESFATSDLYKFALFLSKNKFWNAQIDQIVVHPDQEVSFISRVGNQEVLIGNLNNVETKLEKLKIFYAKALPSTGWGRYSKINLKYDNQIVGTKH